MRLLTGAFAIWNHNHYGRELSVLLDDAIAKGRSPIGNLAPGSPGRKNCQESQSRSPGLESCRGSLIETFSTARNAGGRHVIHLSWESQPEKRLLKNIF